MLDGGLETPEPVELINPTPRDCSEKKLRDDAEEFETPIDLSVTPKIYDLSDITELEDDDEEEEIDNLRRGAELHAIEKPAAGNLIDGMVNNMAMEFDDPQLDMVRTLLEESKSVFPASEFDLGRTNLVKHVIDIVGNRPFEQQHRRHPLEYLPIIDEHVNQMLDNDIFEPWSIAIQCSCGPKRDGSLRFCIDYCQLNV